MTDPDLQGLGPDGFGPDDHADEIAEEDVPGVLEFLEQAGAGLPQPDPEDL